MLKIGEQLFCENCFNKCEKYPCNQCGFTGKDEKRDAMTLPYMAVLQGKYVIGKLLGRGGFGVTYLALDYQKNTRVAIKEYYPAGLVYRQPGDTKIELLAEKEELFKEGEEKFYSEAKTIAKLRENGSIVTVYEFFKENNTSYFVMEYLEGCDLKGFVAKNGTLSEGQAITVIRSVCGALGEAHEKGILHRDISPDNIFVCNDGRIILIDFGAARQLAAEKSQSMSVILKQGFAPIEQYQRKSHHGPWSDVYALGSSIYYSLSAQLPDDAITRMASPEIDFSKNPSLSQGFKDILTKMMAVNASDRYTDTHEVMADLNAVDTKPIPLVSVVSAQKSDLNRHEDKKREDSVPKSEDFGKKTEPENNNKEKKEKKEKKIKPLPFIIGGAVLAVLIVVIILLAKGCSSDIPSGSSDGGYDNNTAQRVTLSPSEGTQIAEDTCIQSDITDNGETSPLEDIQTEVGGITTDVTSDVPVSVSGITISAIPFKTAYSEGDTLNTSGLQIKVTYGDGTSKIVTSGFTTAPANGATLSTSNTKVTVSYEGKTTSYTISVTPLTVTGISVSSNPTKTSYNEGDTLSTSGLKIKVTYNNGTTKTVSSGFATTPSSGATLSTSNTKVTVSYGGKTTSYNITVTPVQTAEVILSGDGYKLTSDGTLTITNNNAMKDYSSYSDRPWHSQRSSIKKIVIQNGVTSIGDVAFSYCGSLTSVTIPNSVTSIGDYAFHYCGSLTSVTIPNSVTSIGANAFASCDSLTSVTIPNSATSIGANAFYSCDSLTSVTIPNSVTSIGDDAFCACHSLTSVTIPNSVTSIGDRAFSYCDSLTAINVSSGNANYTSVDGVLFNKNKTKLIQCPGGKQGVYTIPNSVTSIGDYAFHYCGSLTYVTIPNSVTSIGDGAFASCDSLTSVTIPNSVTSIGANAFYSCDSLQTINFKGTQSQWNAISKGTNWDEYTGNYTIKYSG